MSTNLSYVAYTADGVQTQYDLTFGYLSRSHVFVFVDGVLASYRWVSGTRVQLNLAPDPGQTVKIQRLTDRVNRIVDFQDGTTLLSGDLNASDLQSFYILQEIADQVSDGVLTGAIPVANSGGANGGFVTEQWINEQLESNQYTTDAYIALLERITDEEIARAQAIVDEAQARADAISAAAVAEADARAQDVLALTQADLAAGQRLTTLEQTVDDPSTGLSAKVATLETTTADLETNKAEASVVTAIQSEIDDPTTGLKARATSLEDRATAVENDKAEASDLDALIVRVNDAEADIASEQTARADADSAFTQQLNTQSSRIDDAEGDISSLDTAIANEVGVRVSQINSANARIDGVETSVTNVTQQIAAETQARIDDVADLEARTLTSVRSNLLPNGGFENGKEGWVDGGGSSYFDNSPFWGANLRLNNSSHTYVTNEFNAGPSTYTISADVLAIVSGGQVYMEFEALDSGGSNIGWSGRFQCAFPQDFGNAREAFTWTAPTGTAKIRVWLSHQSTTGFVAVGFRNVKVELGSVATAYTPEASLIEANARVTSNTSLIASEQSSRVSEVSRLEAKYSRISDSETPGLKNIRFQEDDLGHTGVPSGWSDWVYGPTCSTNPSVETGTVNVLNMNVGANQNVGIFQEHVSINPGERYVVTGKVRRRGGTFHAAGIYILWFSAGFASNVGSDSVQFATHPAEAGGNGAYPDGLQTYSKVVTAPAGAAIARVYAMGSYSSFGTQANSVSIDWYEASLKAMTASESTGVDAKATADTNTQLIASETAARASELTNLRAGMASIGGGIIPNPEFGEWGPNQLRPSYWSDYSAQAVTRVTKTRGVGNAVEMESPSGNWGGLALYSHPCTPGKYKVRTSWRRSGGDARPAGILIFFLNSGGSSITAQSISIWNDPTTEGTVNQADFLKEYTHEKIFDAPAGTVSCNIYIMNAYASFPSTSNYTRIQWQNLYMERLGNNEAQVIELKDAIATGSSSQARLLLGVNTANNEASLEAYAGEGDGVWNGSKIKLKADLFEFEGDVIVDGTITADNIAPGSLTNFAYSEPGDVSVGTNWTDVATLVMYPEGIGVELRASCQLYAGALPGGGVGGVGYVRLLRDSTVLREKEAIFTMTNTSSDPQLAYYEGSLDFVLDKNDLPPKGAYTYKLQAKMPGNTGPAPVRTAKQPYLSAREQLR